MTFPAPIIETNIRSRCGMCGYVGTLTDYLGQCPRCRWDDLKEETPMGVKLYWTRNKPTRSGAYWVRGFNLSDPEQIAVVEVRLSQDGLCTNLHSSNTCAENQHWFYIDYLNPKFEWCGPLFPETHTDLA